MGYMRTHRNYCRKENKINTDKTKICGSNYSRSAGKLYVVGIGPGDKGDITQRAIDALKKSDTVIGYKLYIDLIIDIISNKRIVSSTMRKEVERVELAIQENLDLHVEIIPGIPAANAAAAILGAPLMHDYAVISLSDLLTPWETIERRIKCAAEADFGIVLYNPKSSQRDWQIEKAAEIILKYKPANTPVGIVKDASREGESIIITNLKKMVTHTVDMTTIIIIGNSTTFTHRHYMITKRGYNI